MTSNHDKNNDVSTAKKRELLAKLLQEKVSQLQTFPMYFGQQRLWFIDQLQPGNFANHISAALRLTGFLNQAALLQTLNEIVRRHEVLRTTFATMEEKPVQVIIPTLSLNLPTINLEELSEVEQEAEVKKLVIQEIQQPFNLSQAPLLRATLLRLKETEHILVFTMHHIISDGWSMGVLTQEVAVLYEAFSKGQPSLLSELPIQYVDFAAWQRQQLQGELLQSQISYWKNQLEGAPKLLELPTDYPRPAVSSFQGASYSFELSDDLYVALKKLSQQHGSTLFMTLLAAFQILLWRYTGSEDIVVGSPIANRDRTELEGLIGFFANTIALRTNLAGNPTFEDLLTRVRTKLLEAYAHQDLPFEQLVEELQPQRNLSYTPVFQVMFVLQNTPMSVFELPGLTISPLTIDNGSAKFDLTLEITETPEKIFANLEFNTDLFKESTVKRMAGHFQTLLKEIIANPKLRLSELSLLTEAEKRQLLVEWNDTQVNYPQDQCIHQLFEAQVERTPDAVAVVFEHEQLTYRELNTKANQLAHYLRSLGVKPEVLVGICVERSIEMIIGLLAILKAGGAYIPLDPSYPQERIVFILEDTQAPVLLTQESLLEAIPQHKAKVVCLDNDWQTIAQQTQENLLSVVTTDNLAYVIYTSGSTGRPKGVMIQHASTVAMLDWAKKTFAIEAMQGVLASTSICFDLSVFEVFVPLCCGGKVILIENALLLPTSSAALDVTLINTVPSVISQLLITDGIPASVQIVNVAGEPLHNKLVQQLYQQDNIQKVFNLYGPSEDTTYSTFAWIHKDTSNTTPIGRPIHNTQIYLLDQNLQPVPVGVAGMLYIGGAGLARGYLNKAELTAEKFIPYPYANLPGERLYKTGDQARYLPNGDIEYIGRIDYQVKVRGFRIELLEIEAVILEYPAVQEAVVAVHFSQVDSQQIVAYVVPQIEQTLTIPELRSFLEAKLPSYMVPAAFVILSALPLTPNGKINRKALRTPDTARPEDKELVVPQTTLEKQLAGIWTEVLGLENISINDNFFGLGGDSILSLQVISKANQIGLHLTPKQMFQYQTIAQLATVIGTTQKIQAEQGVLTGALELIPIQHWFFAQKQPEPHHWNQAVFLESKQNIDPVVLEKIIKFLQIHHDILRLRFIQQEFSTEALIVIPDDVIPLTYFDFSALPKDRQSPAIKAAATKLQASLNLSQGPLFQVALFNLGDNQPNRLLWIIHHLAVDGVSWRILIEDFQTAYQQISQGKVIKLPPKTTSYKQWSSHLQKYAQASALLSELDFWLRTQYQSVSSIPRDFPDGNNIEETTSMVLVSLSVEETQSLLQQVPAAYQTQINDVLLTALILTFNQWTGENSLLIDLEGHGREEIFEDVDLSRTIGWFTTIFPVHLKLENTNEQGKVLKSIKEQLRAIPNRGIGYGLFRYLCQDREIAEKFSSSKAEVAFNYLGQFDRVLPESSLFSFAKESSGSTRSLQSKRTHLLEINGGIYQGHLEMSWSYSNKLHRQTTIEVLAQRFIGELRSLIAHCLSPNAGGFTPSDFADFQQSQWDQTDLDAITAAMGDM
ncbi:MAG: amino acid adenylation domain-containing protein [Nostoc sp. DedQUE04]|uniref:non-ribosomal peptide synthetase n=1 Tax=Nostoc sp. DedQUE04 TaxID=3075390 RepID=UPI002AD58ABB|nr:non-ribosomal peptide synthetase [Nostoc sp. DedQUE04]MDZ8135367.1 amino acid adenylation domain-containing protein [Nostoc sp. DedQUE04]